MRRHATSIDRRKISPGSPRSRGAGAILLALGLALPAAPLGFFLWAQRLFALGLHGRASFLILQMLVDFTVVWLAAAVLVARLGLAALGRPQPAGIDAGERPSRA